MQIAIDGPAGAGKSSVASRLAKELGIIHLDTGAMYRAFTYSAMEHGIEAVENEALHGLLRQTEVGFDPLTQHVLVNGEDVNDQIRKPEVTANVSYFSKLPSVREMLTKRQQAIAEKQSVIMDGRDIGTVVLPNADYKFFLNASVEERARRRVKDLQNKGLPTDLDKVRADIEARDFMDENREISPLRCADDAQIISTDHFTENEIVMNILQIISN